MMWAAAGLVLLVLLRLAELMGRCPCLLALPLLCRS